MARSTTSKLILLSLVIQCWVGLASGGEPLDVAFKARHDGSEQRYVVVLPEGFDPANSYDVLVVLHGHGSDRWQFVKQQRDECRAARDAAGKANMILVSPDYRAKTSWMGPAAEADLLQILDEVRKTYRVDRVVLSGASMGGTAALIFASLHPREIAGVVAMNGTANMLEYEQFQDAIVESYGGTKVTKEAEYERRSPELHAEQLTMPIATTTGGKDTVVPPASVLRLMKALKKQDRAVEMIHRPDGGHETTYDDAMAAFEFVFDKTTLSK